VRDLAYFLFVKILIVVCQLRYLTGCVISRAIVLSYSVFDFDFFLLFFVSGPCARLRWPSRQLLSARKSTVSYRIVS